MASEARLLSELLEPVEEAIHSYSVRYLQVFEDLKRKKRWSTDTNVLRFAALTLAASEIDDPGGRLEAAADELRR